MSSLGHKKVSLICATEVRVRRYSASDTYGDERVSQAAEELQPEAIVGFVTCLVKRK